MKKNKSSSLYSKGRYLSLLLRHKPEQENLNMDSNGWVNVNQILISLNLRLDELEKIVSENNKRRFSFNSDKSKIRANLLKFYFMERFKNL